MVEDLDDLLTLDHLLNIAVDRAQRLLLLLEADPAAAADVFHHQQHQRQKHKGNQRQNPVQIQHHANGTQKGQGAGNQAGEAVIQHFRNGVDVVCEAAHQVAGLVRVKIPQRQLLHPAEQIAADGCHGTLGNVHHDAGIGKGAQRRQAEGTAQQHQHPDQAREIAGQDIIVDNGLEKEAAQNRGGAAEHQTHGYQHQRALIAGHIAQQLFHRALHILGLLIPVAGRAAAGAVAPLLHVSHQCSPLPAETGIPRGKSGWFSSVPRGCPRRKFCRRPAPQSCPRPARRKCAGQ